MYFILSLYVVPLLTHAQTGLLDTNFGITKYLSCVSTLNLINDNVVYHTNGSHTGGVYNVLSNDQHYDCTTNTYVPLTSYTPVTSTTMTPAYFSIFPDGSIHPNTGLGGTIPTGTYHLSYTVCDASYPFICATQYVYIIVDDSLPFAPTTPAPAPLAKNKVVAKNTASPINIPDANLLNCLTEINNGRVENATDGNFLVTVDTNGDGQIDHNEALLVGRLNLSGLNISDLTGLENFTNMTVITLIVDNITTFNLPLDLHVIGLGHNPISSINLSNYPNLIGFGMRNTPISTIDLGTAHNLTGLLCGNNPNLSSINIKNTSSLDYSSPAMTNNYWTGLPNLNTICADSFEIPALQSYLAGCGVNTTGIDINSNCALGVEGAAMGNGVSISPNPSSGIFEVHFDSGVREKTNIVVYNVMGQNILTQDCTGADEVVRFDLSGFPSGAYLVKITSSNAVLEKTILKN